MERRGGWGGRGGGRAFHGELMGKGGRLGGGELGRGRERNRACSHPNLCLY